MRFQTTSSQISNIKTRQEDLARQQRDIRELVKELGEFLDSTFMLNWNQTFPGTKPEIIPGVDGGSMTNTWEPEVYLYSINGIRPAENGRWYDGDREATPPVMLSKLQEFLLLFLQMTQVPVKIAYITPPKEETDW